MSNRPEGLVRLNKLLAERGLCSRREGDRLISAGSVRVDGEVAVVGLRVRPDAVVAIDGAGQEELAKRETVILHKPRGYVSHLPQDDQREAKELIREQRQWREDPKAELPDVARLSVAGRLDRSSRGLLILSSDGRVVKAITGSWRHAKKYLVECQTRAEDDQLSGLQEMRRLGQESILPMEVTRLKGRRLRFVLREGKKHQIREACHQVGLEVSDLYRVQMGPLELGALPEGRWRWLSAGELQSLIGEER